MTLLARIYEPHKLHVRFEPAQCRRSLCAISRLNNNILHGLYFIVIIVIILYNIVTDPPHFVARTKLQLLKKL